MPSLSMPSSLNTIQNMLVALLAVICTLGGPLFFRLYLLQV
jgi:hypothetical protein